eukprot:128377_1
MSYKPIGRLDDGRALYLYPARDADHTYLWAVTWMQAGSRRMIAGTCLSSTAFKWENPQGLEIVFLNGKNVNQQLEDALVNIRKLQSTMDNITDSQLEAAEQKSKVLMNLPHGFRDYPFYPDKYEVVCKSARSEDPCGTLRGVYYPIGVGAYDYNMNGAPGQLIPFLQWLGKGVGIERDLVAADLRRYSNGRGAILHVTHDSESNKKYGYCLSITGGSQRPGSSVSSDSFERDMSGIRLYINNAESLGDLMKGMVEGKKKEFSIDKHNTKDVMLVITSSLLGIILIVKCIAKCKPDCCVDGEDDLDMQIGNLTKHITNHNIHREYQSRGRAGESDYDQKQVY